eukprot:TRINITY_DN6566_c0_g1_i1.p1 TRINITY_DN6566_c0_g1~~TRINITY_DN6566_c0_g1_i1.p1  ORF type:complete len:1230 (+),score=370.31 TRINITY_DN6566_c0_g1_i1:414-3692(+)
MGTQIDLENKREILTKEGHATARNYKCPFYEVSAKESSKADMARILGSLITEIKEARRKEQVASINSKKSIPIEMDLARKSGLVNVTSKSSFKGFKKTWLALLDGVLFMFMKEKEFKAKIPSTAEALEHCTVKEVKNLKDKKDKNFYIEVLVRKGNESVTYTLQLEDEEEKADWLHLLEYNVHLYSRKAIDKTKAEENQRVGQDSLKKLQSVPGNLHCADCSAPNPDWVLENIGALVCIQCAGVHRNIKGAHSKSVLLDNIDEDVLKVLMAIGNEKVNKIWEARITEKFKKPKPGDSRKDKEEWICAKFVDKSFLQQVELNDDLKWDLKKCLENKIATEILMKFLESEFSSENLKFYKQVQDLRLIRDEQEIATVADHIYRHFIGENAEESINIPDNIAKELQKNYNDKSLLTANFFDRAARSIFDLMEADSWKRFLISDFYKNLVSQTKAMVVSEKLISACSQRNLSDVMYWIAHGADVSMSDSHGKTPLHIAAIKRDAIISQFLILNGSQVDVPDMDAKLPITYAKDVDDKQMESLLSNQTMKLARRQKKFTDLQNSGNRTLRPVQLETAGVQVKFDSRIGINKFYQDMKMREARAARAMSMDESPRGTIEEGVRRSNSPSNSPPASPNIKMLSSPERPSSPAGQSRDRTALLPTPVTDPIIKRAEYRKIFQENFGGKTHVSRDQVFPFFEFVKNDFDNLWKLVDFNKDGEIDEEEFCILHHLADEKFHGNFATVPTVLPQEILPNLTILPNGDMYIGVFNSQGEYNGKGKYIFSNGISYEGQFYAGRYNGFGFLRGDKGEKFQGIFKEDKYHGQGTCQYSNGDSYTGMYSEGERHGKGVYVYNSGNRYVGEFSHGECHGHGTLFHDSIGERYEGNFKNGEYTDGIYFYSNGDKFEGHFLEDRPDGNGTFYYANGDKYQGEMKAGLRCGQGKYTSTAGDVQQGTFVNERLNGNGVATRNGNRYEGVFKDGILHGYGGYYGADKTQYQGGFDGGRFHGKGTCRFPDGSQYVGDWDHGVRQGFGKLTLPNGEFYSGRFERNAIIRGSWVVPNGSRYDGDLQDGRPHGRGKLTQRGEIINGEFDEGVLINRIS